MKNYSDETENLMPRQHQPSNSRNNHARMPSLPNNIKGSIGINAPGNFSQLNTQQNMNTTNRKHNGSVPLNIAASDITFANNYNQMRKYGPNAT